MQQNDSATGSARRTLGCLAPSADRALRSSRLTSAGRVTAQCDAVERGYSTRPESTLVWSQSGGLGAVLHGLGSLTL